MPITGWIEIDDDYCKGCGLCVWACPQEVLILDENELTMRGYHPVRLVAEGCTGCALCSLMCPESALNVYQEKPERNPRRRVMEKANVA